MNKAPRTIPRTPSAYEYPLIVKQLLHTAILYAPDQEIVYRDTVRFTYLDLYRRINRLASGLDSIGVGPGDTVAVLDWDSHRYLECFFAVPMMGAILHTVNVRLSPDQILFTMNHAEDSVVLVHEDFLPILESVADRLKTVKKYVVIKEGPQTPSSKLSIEAEYEELLGMGEEQFRFPDFQEDTWATTFYTTGTTGDPKGVYYSHRQLVLHTLAVAAALGSYTAPGRFQSADVYMPITPMFHVHAWGLPYVATLLGAKQVYPGRYEPAKLLELLANEKVTFSHCVPTILHMLLTSPAAANVDLKGWKVIIGGSALSRGLAKAAMERGVDIFTGYGMSETCPVLTLATLKPHMMDWEIERQLDVRTLTGIPIPLVNLRTDDLATGESAPMDGRTPGEIVVRAPWLTQGYFKSPENSEVLWKNGWLHTGDVATMNPEGYVRITDRIKDVIKTGGEWISSLELESLISQYEHVSEVAVVGVPDEKWGERPLAMVVPRKEYEKEFSQDELRSFLKKYVEEGTLSKWAIPEKIVVSEQIPKTSVGKIDKKAIRGEVIG